MKIRPENKAEDLFKPVGFWPVGTKSKKSTILVDKSLNIKKKTDGYDPSRSIFNIHDFKHDVMTKKDHEFYQEFTDTQNFIQFTQNILKDD